MSANATYRIHPDFWVGQRWFPTSGKWHLLYASGRPLCGSSVEIHEDGPFSGIMDDELCDNCKRSAVARRIEIEASA